GRRHARPDREDRGVNDGDRDAHGLGHDTVLHGRPDPDAELAVLEEEEERPDDGRGEQGGGDPVPGVLEVEERELRRNGLLELPRRRAPLPERVLLEHERDPKRREDRRERVAAEERPECRDLEDRAERGDDERRDHQREPEVARDAESGGAREGSEHHELSVSEVHHVHDPEDERQPRGHQRQDHAVDEAVDRLDEELLEREAHGAQTPRYWWMTAWLARRSAAGAWWRTTPFSMM